MNSHLNKEFRTRFGQLPERIKRQAVENYKLWKMNPQHPGLAFKRVGKRLPVYSVRVGIGWRALGIVSEDTIVWYWIGSHEEYNHRIKGA